MLTFERNGDFTSKDFSDASASVLQNVSGTWYVEGQTLVIREHRKGIASLLDNVPGVTPLEVTEATIISVSGDELLFGDRDAPITYERTASAKPTDARSSE